MSIQMNRKRVKFSNHSVRILAIFATLTIAVVMLGGSTFAESVVEAGAGPEGSELLATAASSNLPVEVSSTTEYPHRSLLFTVADVVFFSYEDGTMLELYDSSNTLIWNNGGAPLDKGGHAHVSVSQGVYLAKGSEKFAILSGDPITRYVCGYYAMDQNGYGASTELYTWVPELFSHCKFVVFAYEDNTNVTVEYTDTGIDIGVFTLNKGEHWDIETLSSKWLHVTADKPVSALTCYDQGYFVPSATGRWSGTEFYTYVSDIQSWPEDLTVIAYEDDTQVTIVDTDSSTTVWTGMLDSGQAHVEGFPSGADKFFAVTSDKDVTVCVQPWVSMTSAYHQGAYIQDRNGAGIGIDLIGSTIGGGYLYILAYKDGTTVDIYNSQTGVWVANYALNEGDYVQANPGNGLWRIISSEYVSAYSGYGQWNADFVPVEFGGILLIPVSVDIKPQSCPNPLNVKSNGVLPVAILGTEDFDVRTIDVATILLEGVSPIRSNYEDVATPVPDGNECDCTTEGPDGFTDLTLKFNTQDIVATLGEVKHGDELVLTLDGALFEELSGTPIQGADCIVIRGKHKPLSVADINKDGLVNTLDFAVLAENWLESSTVQD